MQTNLATAAMETHDHLRGMEQMSASIAAKDKATGPGSTSDSSTDGGTIPAAYVQVKENLDFSPLGAAAATKLSVAQQLNQRLAELRTVEQGITLEPAKEPPAKDLSDVSHRLKKLEKAVKSHLLGGLRIAGDASILASACGGRSILSHAGTEHHRDSSTFAGLAACDPPSPGGARLSERSRLKESLSDIKSDIADLAVRKVEAQLLQQRVLRLEAAIGGFGGLGGFVGPVAAAGLSSSFTSLAGTTSSPGVASGGAGGCAAAVHEPREDAAPGLTRSPSDVSVLVHRLAGMEGVIKELAQAQVANTAVLQQIGGRLPSPVPASPSSQCYNTAAVGGFAPSRSSPVRSYPRPPSCPLTGGLLNSPFGYSPPEAAQLRGRAPSPDSFGYPRSSFASATAYASPSHASSGVFRRSDASSAASPTQASVYPAIPAMPATGQQPTQQQQAQMQYPTPWEQPLPQQRPQQQWQVEVVLAGHDADIAQVKEAVQQLEQHQQAADESAEATSAEVGSLVDRVAALEQSMSAVVQPGEATLRHMLQPADGGSASTEDAAASYGAAAVGTLDQADLVSAIEGLAADAVQAVGRLDALEGSLEHQLAAMDDLQGSNEGVQAQLQQVSSTMAELLSQVQSLQAASAATPPADHPAPSASPASTALAGTADRVAQVMGSSVTCEEVPQQVLRQLLNSTELQQLVDAKVEQLLHFKVEEAVAAQLAEAAGHAADMAASAAEAVSAVSSPAQSNSRLQALLSEDSASDGVGSLPSAVSCCPTPRVPCKLQDAFDALSKRLQKMQSLAAAGQAEVIHEALQHLHNRLLQVEEVVAQDCMNQQHNALETYEHTQQRQPVIQPPAGSSSLKRHRISASSGSLSAEEVSDDQPLLADEHDVAAEAPVDKLSAPANRATEEHQQQLAFSGAGIGVIDNDSTDRADFGRSVQWPKLVNNDGAPAVAATLSSDMHAAAAADVAIADEASSASTDQLERQVAALQQEMTSHQVTELQSAVEGMCRQMVAMQQALAQQAALIDQQRASTAASFAVLSPLEPRVCELAGQLAVLSDIAAQQPSKLEALQKGIEQLSRHLTEVNEGAADEAELADLKTLTDTVIAQQGSLQLQLDATQAVAAAAVQAATAASAEVVKVTTAAQEGSKQEDKDVATIVPAAAEQLEALEASVQQQLASTQEALTKLQTEVEGRISEAAAQAAAATAAAANHFAEAQLLSERAGALASKLAALEVAVAEDKVAAQCLLEQKTNDLQTAAAAHEGMLHRQMETMAHVLADLGQAKAEQAGASHQLQQQVEALSQAQAQAAASQTELQSSLSRQLTATVQQLHDELQLALGPLQQQLSAAKLQLAEHEQSIGSCAKASVLAGVVATLQDLPSAVEGLTGRLDELAQTQRAAEGQLRAAQEQHIVLNGQLATLKQCVETLASNVEQQKGHLSGEVERVSSELLAPVWADLQQLQESKQTLLSSQEQQAGAVQQLGAAVNGVRMDVMSELARSKDELAQSIEELQTIIKERCLKTDQLGQIFAARDNMYGAWMKMQAVFESNKSHSGATSSGRISASNMLFKRRPSSTMSASTSMIADQHLTPFASTSNAAAAGAAQQPAADAFDPFTEMATRESSHSIPCPSTTMAQVEAVPAAAAAPVTPEAVMAASTSQQTASVAAESSCTAVVTPADLAAVLESHFQLRQTVAQLLEQTAALQQAQRQQVLAEPQGALNNSVPSAEDCSGILGQLHAAVAQLSQQLAAVQRQQMQMTTPPATPALQSHSGLTQRSDSSAFLLTLQQELAGIALQVSELHTKVQKQEVQIEAVLGTSASVLPTVTEAADAVDEYTEPMLCQEPSAMCHTAAAAGAGAADRVEELQQQLGALAAKVDDLQQQSFASNAESGKEDETVGQKGNSVADDPPPASPAGVLNAPLSVVVQLQEELAGLKESQVSKDQFAAVVRMVREQKDHSTATDAINRETATLMGSTLRQHAEQLAGVEFSIDSILLRLEATAAASVEAVDLLSQQQQLQQQQQSNAAAIEDLSHQHAMLVSDLASMQKALEQQAAALDDSSVSAQEHAYQLTSQQHTTESLTAELASMAASVEDLSAKLAAEREAHMQLASMVNVATAAANMPRRAFSEGQEAPGSGFSELVAGIARLKDCMDTTSQTVSGLQQRLEVQEAVIAELAAAAAQTPRAAAEAVLEEPENVAQVAATAGETQEPLLRVSSSLAHSSSDQQQTVLGANFATKGDVAQQEADLQAQVEHLKEKIAAVERQQQQHQEQHERQKQPAALIPSYSRSVSGSGRAIDAIGSVIAASASAISTSATFSRRVSKISSIAAADAVELTAAAADEAAVAVAGPMALVHQILMELKKRVEALEAAAAAAAAVSVAPQAVQAGTSTAPIMRSNQLFVPGAVAATPGSTRPAARKPASWQTAGDAASVTELQELVISLQQDVARIDMESSSNAANLMSLRGDVGAAAAAAAQVAAAATAASNRSRRFASIREREPGAAAAAVASFDAASISAEASAASAVAAAAQEAAAQAQAAASAVQDGLRALTQELQQLQTQMADSRLPAESSPPTMEDLPAVHASAVTALRDEVSSLKATVDQISSDSVACSGRAAEEQANLSSRLQDVEEQVQQALAAAASSTATATAAVSAVGPAIEYHEQLQQLQQELAELKRQLTQCLTSAAAEAGAATAVAELKLELQALQDQVAWASSEAAAAACTAASNAVEDVKEQLVEDLQGQLGRAVARSLHASLAGVAPELAAAAAVAAVDGASEAAADTSVAACAMPATACTGAAQPTCSSGLSFNDLASAPSPTSRALVQQLLASIATATRTGDTAADQPAEKPVATLVAGNIFEPNFNEASLPPPPQQQQQSPSVPAVDGGVGSLVGDNTGAAPAAGIAVGDLSSQQLLGAQLALLSAPQQVEFVCKLAGVVSSQATRLLATYQDDPALAKQLHTVQERLSAAVASAGAAGKAARTSESSSAVAAVARRFSASSSISSRSDATQRPDAAVTGGFAAGQVLLGILDQVASLRAIGSATHPAISQALQKHEAQIAALLEAQQLLQKTHDTNIVASFCGSAALASETATVQGSGTSSKPDAAAPAAANGSGGSFEGECNQRLSSLESRLASGLKVLSEVRSKLSPLREVADATQSMMRELQVAHGLVLQRLEGLEDLASAGAGADGAGADERKELSSSALAVAGSMRQMQADVLSLSRRLLAAEAKLASTSECLTLSRRLAARMADADNRGAQLAGKVSSIASSLPVVVEHVVDLEGRLGRSLGVAKRGLDILADQLVALGALNGRGSPSKNPLAALGPNHAAITALEGKVEAVRTAMTASVRLMIADLATDAATAGSIKAAPGLGQADLGAGVVSAQLAASEAVNAAVASHQEALNGLESKIADMQAELHTALAAVGKENLG